MNYMLKKKMENYAWELLNANLEVIQASQVVQLQAVCSTITRWSGTTTSGSYPVVQAGQQADGVAQI